MAVPDFVAGMIYGFTGDNELPEIETCLDGSVALVQSAEQLLADLEAQDWVRAIIDYTNFSTQLKDSLHLC